jgi:hypothetical protein
MAHMESIYGRPGNKFRYGKTSVPPGITVGATQNAGYDKKNPLNGS